MKVATAEQMREIDRRAAEEFGISTAELMERAGMAVALSADRLLRESGGTRVLVLCGRGNNGGDGFVAGRLLHNKGYGVEIWLAGEQRALRGDAEYNCRRAKLAGVPVREILQVPEHFPPCDLLIDALLGTGLREEVRGVPAELIDRINQSSLPVLSVDIPSGLDSDTGRPRGRAVRAQETVTFGLPKVGMVIYPGVEYVGRLRIDDIGLPPTLLQDPKIKTHLITEEDARSLLPPISPVAHKGSRGRVLVVAGSRGYTGAATLTSLACLRSGAGLVWLACPESLNNIYEVKLTEVITLPVPEAEGGRFCRQSLSLLLQQLNQVNALAIGPGLTATEEPASLLAELLPVVRIPTVLDADGLNLLAQHPDWHLPPECILTPHPGELSRLMGLNVSEIQENRLQSALDAARRFQRVVLLKGARSVIATPEGEIYINPTGNPGLASAGTGDVLTGVIAGLLARGVSVVGAAQLGAYLHGLSADLIAQEMGTEGMIASDVLNHLPKALFHLRQGGSTA